MHKQNLKPRRRLIVIVGPTASGKSSLSMLLARHFRCPILSTDSRQVYRGIPIGTAQPSAQELQEVEHHFIADRSLEDDFNAGTYEIEALERLSQLFKKHENVVAVGGSGLYIKALCEGLDSLPEVSDECRSTLRARYAEEGLEPLLEELKRLDPVFYEQVDRSNSSRVLRALEVCQSSSMPYSSFRSGESKPRDFEIIKIGLDLPRELLYERIDSRVDIMLCAGLEAEARAVYPLRSLNSLQTVGYRELFDYFSGDYDLARGVELIKRNSRRYAKRQMTWFRRDPSIIWFNEIDLPSIINSIASPKSSSQLQ